ncbi:amidohydrolase [Paenibacillus terrigena]|uniref:amidohydrolase n=1 Tax=Paenibacillus terrigena TaxID=369333 RepID=UPI0028D1D02D|nr:amidohydrolase [Paenibacillus terrigena]
MEMKFREDVLLNIFSSMVEWRRYLHKNPELSYKEAKTAQFVADRLRTWGIEVKTGVGGHGVVGTLRGDFPGKTIALRADMDALPIQDEKTCDYASTVPGVMHACGHDGHTSTLLGIANYYSQHRDMIRGELRFIFQPAEETCPGGAIQMIDAGVLEGVDIMYGVHLWTPISVGKTASVAGPLWAAADEFFIDIEGRGGHGGVPHVTVDSVLVGAALIMNLQTIVSRSVDPLDSAVVTVGSMQAGTMQNIIAERCSIMGTARTFNQETRSLIKRRIETIVEQTCAMYGADVHLNYLMGYPPLVNDAAETARYQRIATHLFGEEQTIEAPKMMPAEDFAYYLQRVPGCFILVGAGNEEKGMHYPHHHPRFDFDEQAMYTAAKLLIHLAADAMMNE